MMSPEAQKKFDNVKVGDILVGRLSYTMTFYSFFEVVGKTKCSLKLQKLQKYSLSGPMYATPVKPIFDSKDGPVITRRVSKYGSMMENGDYSTWINLDNKYNPNEKYEEDYMD